MENNQIKTSFKIGKFHISVEKLRKAILEEDQEILKQLRTIFSQFIIIDAKFNLEQEVIEYTAYHPQLPNCATAEIMFKIPHYIFEFEMTEDEQGNKDYKIVNIREDYNAV